MHKLLIMRTTVDIPDELLRRAKSEAALQGRTLRDMIEEGLRRVLDQEPPAEKAADRPQRRKPSLHDTMKDMCGVFDDGPRDLSTNKSYFDDFGR